MIRDGKWLAALTSTEDSPTCITAVGRVGQHPDPALPVAARFSVLKDAIANEAGGLITATLLAAFTPEQCE